VTVSGSGVMIHNAVHSGQPTTACVHVMEIRRVARGGRLGTKHVNFTTSVGRIQHHGHYIIVCDESERSNGRRVLDAVSGW
jgi:hypothetical protein